MRRATPRSWIAVLTAALVLVVGAAVPAAAKGKPPSTASKKATYVAMGDSFASGNGTFNPDLDNACYRSSDAYAPLVAKALRRTTLSFVACSGATTASIAGGQDAALNAKTTYVSISIGGNDIGFTDLITACVSGGDATCAAAVDTASSAIANDLPGKLATTYTGIRSKASKAKVVVVGYPRGFDPERVSCFQGTGITSTEAGLLNDLTDDLDAVIETAATSAGFTYVDPNGAFAGHDVCARTPYVNGFGPVLSGDTRDAYHPTAAGMPAASSPSSARPSPPAEPDECRRQREDGAPESRRAVDHRCGPTRSSQPAPDAVAVGESVSPLSVVSTEQVAQERPLRAR